jgi:hypothetical protein
MLPRKGNFFSPPSSPPFVLIFFISPLLGVVILQRFEHTNNHNVKSSTKVDTYIGFPEELDMYPYLSSTLLKKRQQATVVRNPSPLPSRFPEL